MRLVLLAAAALAASAGGAFAGQPAVSPDRAARQVTVCDRATDSRDGWIRECAGLSAASGTGGLTPAKAERATRQVFVCNRSAEFRRSWMREYGAMTFITAEELNRAEASNEGWSSPRCMTSAQMQKFAKGRPEEVTVARALNAAPGL